MNGTDGLTALQRKVAARPPLMPALPPMHPRSEATKAPSLPAPELASVGASNTVARKAQRRPLSAQSAASRPTFAERVSRVQLRTDQDAWVRRLLSEAMAAGDHVAEADVLRVALDRLREGKAGWAELREAILAETERRSRRR